MRKHRLQDIALGMLLMALVMGLAIPALAAVTTKTLKRPLDTVTLVLTRLKVCSAPQIVRLYFMLAQRG